MLGRFVAIPSGIPNTNISIQYGVLAFIAAVYGPIAGLLAGLIGHFLIDFSYGWGVWWSWVIASAFFGCVMGFLTGKYTLEDGEFSKHDAVGFNIMIDVILHRPQDQHASLLGALIARRIAGEAGIKAYIYDAVTVDELDDICHITGLPSIRRVGQGHQLNMRAAALKYCGDRGLDYASVNLLVAHLGGGITVSLHMHGRVADMSNDEEGPFAPERAGCLPATPFLELCFGGEYSKKDVVKLLKGKGGSWMWRCRSPLCSCATWRPPSGTGPGSRRVCAPAAIS